MAEKPHPRRRASARREKPAPSESAGAAFRAPVESPSSDSYRLAFEAARDALFILDEAGHILDANPAALRFARASLAQLADTPFHQLSLFRNSAFDPAALHELFELESLRLRATLNDQSSDSVEAEILASVYMDGGQRRALLAIRDLSELKAEDEQRRRYEEQIRQQERMEAVGRLAGGIAHEFNNLLTAIIGYSDLLRSSLKNDPLRQSVEEIRDAGMRAAALTRQLLAFGKKPAAQPGVLSVNEVLVGMEEKLRVLMPDNVELVIAPGEKIGRVRADWDRVEQMLLNLSLNARDAMPEGGKLTITTSNVDLERVSEEHPTIPPGKYTVIAVADTGNGLTPEARSHIFEPFYATRDKTLGLGLTTVYATVKQSGGHIWAWSEVGKGALFRVYLPRLADTGIAAPATARPRGEETVLVVEDEPSVRRLAREVLHECGYKVLEASNGAEALRISRQFQSPIHLLITDIFMPQISGQELADRVAAQRPGLRVIFTSGYPQEEACPTSPSEVKVPFIQKPFTPDNLARAVRDTLDATAS